MSRTEQGKKMRILIAKPGLDAHIRGVHVLSKAFRDAGMEVIYTGHYQTAEMIVNAAINEDVDLIAVSILGGSYKEHFSDIMSLLKERKAEEICVAGGGIIHEKDKPFLESIGVTGNYGPGTPLDEIVDHIRERVRMKGEKIG